MSTIYGNPIIISSMGGAVGISDFTPIAWDQAGSDYAIAEIDKSHDYLVFNIRNGKKIAIISNNSFVFLSPDFSNSDRDYLEISGSELHYSNGPFGMGTYISVFEISY